MVTSFEIAGYGEKEVVERFGLVPAPAHPEPVVS